MAKMGEPEAKRLKRENQTEEWTNLSLEASSGYRGRTRGLERLACPEAPSRR